MQLVAMIPVAKKADLEAALSAIKADQFNLTRPVTDDLPATTSSPVTDYLMNDESAVPADATLYADCKAGSIPGVDVNDQSIIWGEGGLPTSEDAAAAFAQLEWQLNDSAVPTGTFVADFLENLERDFKPLAP